MRTPLLAAAIGSVALACALPAEALPQSKPAPSLGECWLSVDFEDFRPINDHSFYMRTRSNDYWLVTTSQCTNLTSPQARLITQVRGSDQICSPVDWDLRVAQGGGVGGFAEPCIVQSQRRLSKEEAAAIPRALKP